MDILQIQLCYKSLLRFKPTKIERYSSIEAKFEGKLVTFASPFNPKYGPQVKTLE